MMKRFAFRLVVLTAFVGLVGAGQAQAQAAAQEAKPAQGTEKPFEPYSGQPGKDVVWVPTPQALVDKMLDMAKVTPQDFVVDLGSGDGRTVITAAKRGARAMGVEYNPDMVGLAKRNATAAGVGDKAQFVQGDIFETDFSKATVVTLFLLPNLNLKLRPTILNMRPGTRVVSNSFTMDDPSGDDWVADQTETIPNCTSWCTALMWIVPAKVEGSWQVGSNTLTLDQEFQMLSGRLGNTPITDAKMNGAEIAFSVGSQKYTGRVDGNQMSGTITGGGTWKATKR
jgi:hypothetical protein